MCEIKPVKAEQIFPIIGEIIENNVTVKISVKGMSMYPFLRDTIDRVELMQINFSDIKRGDIVLIRIDNTQYIMHRVIKKEKDCFYLLGDSQQGIEGPFKPEQLFALITAVWRREKRIECSNKKWKILSAIWLLLRPFRFVLLKTYGYLRWVGKII
jgi:signal peptidase I